VQEECRLSIITINYNGLADTCALIDSITFTDDTEVIVVDNASRTDEASVIEQRYPKVKVIRSEKNLGFAGGNNLGIKSARGRYLLLINNDTVLKDDWNIDSLIRRFDTSARIGMVCPKIRFAWGDCPIQYAGYTSLSRITMRNQSIGFNEPDQGQHDFSHPTPYAHGAAMLTKREVVEHVGLMPECYFLYYEELDWSMKFRQAGYFIWYDSSSTIYHKESQTTGKNSPVKAYYITRNRLLYVHRNNQSSIKYLSYAYLIGIVATRDIVRDLLKGRLDLVKATIRGIVHFLKL